MNQEEAIKPHFHYHCQGEVTAVDCQYNSSGSRLALSFSNGTITVHQSGRQLNNEQIEKNSECKYSDPNQIFLKLAWSYSEDNFLAAASISKQIFCFRVNNFDVQCLRSITTTYIPVFLCFYPSLSKSIITVGFAGGGISLYSDKLKLIHSIVPHKEGVNWLSWEYYLYTQEKNKWVRQNFPEYLADTENINDPLLLSGSSDKYVKIWALGPKFQLVQLYSFQAHSREIRQVIWKPIYFKNQKKYFITCSEDGYVKSWNFSYKNQKISMSLAFERNFGAPVYKAEYNHLGTLIAIRYFKSRQDKIETKIFKQSNGNIGEEVKISEQEKSQS